MYKIETQMQIAMLSMENSVIKKSLLNEYNDKIAFEIDGNVYIRNLSTSDEAKYKITITKTETWVCEVQLVVWVAPTTNCKPKIKRVDNVLTVHLEANDCGKPVPSVHWLNHSGIFFEETKAIKLPPGRQSGIYYACIEGDALTCAKSSKLSDYCSFFKVDDRELYPDHARAGVSKNDNLQEPSSSDQDVAANIVDNVVKRLLPVLIVIAISSVFSVILLFILSYYLLFKRKEQPSQDHDEGRNDAKSEAEEQQSKDHDEHANAAPSDVEESTPMLPLEIIKEQPPQNHDERENAAQSEVEVHVPGHRN